MVRRKQLSQILYAASAALVLAACADRPTEPDTDLPDGNSSPEAAVVKFWEAGSTVAWNGIARDFLIARAFNPFLESRVLTYLSLAQYNAIVAAENSQTPGIHASRAGAAAGASVVVLKDFFPGSAESELIDNRIAAQEAGSAWPGETHEDFAAGEAIGRTIGAAVVAYAHSDNTGLATLPAQLTGPGFWTSTAPVRGLFGTRPLTLTSPDQFREPPVAFGSATFLADLEEVVVLTQTRTASQLTQAQFWNARVARYQNEIATAMIVSHRRPERDAAHLLALANMAGFDALIGCWDAKLTYWYIRPWQADSRITSLPIGLPNHPSYPSGHSCVTAAYSTILGNAFPDERPGLAANVEAAGLSRMYGGLHYRFEIVAGQVLGRQVAEHVLSTDAAGNLPIPLD